jgi:hypothetical protein
MSVRKTKRKFKMKISSRSQKQNQEEQIFRQFCLSNDLATYDPYDIWKTSIGFRVKNLFNISRFLGAIPAMILTLYDLLLNNRFRFGYKKQEYPIVRALAAQVLLNNYQRYNDKELLPFVENHLAWLEENMSKGYTGACWGLGFRWSALKNVMYEENTPHTTHTPYALEAFHLYNQLVGAPEYIDLIKSCFRYYEKDVFVMFEDDDMMAVSYGPFKDRIVINASSYTLYAYSIFLEYFPEHHNYILKKIMKLYRFILENQQTDGSWFYCPDDKNSFIDCFHTCIIVKNLLKANNNVKIEGLEIIVGKGYKYITEHFFNKKYGLYKRFTKINKPSLTKFDLYDNAEVLNIANMMEDTQRVKDLETAINYYFIEGKNVYSIIDYLGIRRNKNTLRWAVMPYLYALSSLKNKI